MTTNYERIKNMSIEEMAEQILELNNLSKVIPLNATEIKKFLQQEAQDE